MAAAMKPLATTTLASTAALVTFSGISQSYRDLYLVINAKDTTSGGGVGINLNADLTSSYTEVFMESNGSTATSSAPAARSNIVTGWNNTTLPTTNFSNMLIHFMDYTATDKHKTVLIRANSADNGVGAVAARWASTSAITSMTIAPSVAFAIGSTFTLYGVAA